MANQNSSMVDVRWLADNLGDPNQIVLDCRVIVEQRESDGGYDRRGALPEFEEAHIPDAQFADLMGDLTDLSSSLDHVMPSPTQMVSTMQKLGLNDDSNVVVYAGELTAWAARVWWMLRWVGFEGARVLDGGLPAWTAAGHSTQSGPSETRSAGTLSLNLQADLVIKKDGVLAALGKPDTKIIDARAPEQFTGELSSKARPGHIPGASNVDSYRMFDGDSGLFRDLQDLRQIFDHIGRPEEDPHVITYCGSGIAASAMAHVLGRLGYNNVSVYVDSMQDWAYDPDVPMETGEAR